MDARLISGIELSLEGVAKKVVNMIRRISSLESKS